MQTFDFEQLLTQHAAQNVTGSAFISEDTGQTPQLDQPESTPGCLVPYEHVHTRPAPPAVHGGIDWPEVEPSEIFCDLIVWLAAARQADTHNEHTRTHQDSDGGSESASVGHPQPGQMASVADGLVA